MNLLYKIGIFVAMLLASVIGNGQSRSYKIYDAYNNEEGFTYFAFSKSMIDMIDIKLDDEAKKVTGDLREIRVMLYNPTTGKLKTSFGDEMALRLKNMNYQKSEPKDNSGDGEFWIEGNGNKVRECHLIIPCDSESSYGCLVSFYGNFTVEDLAKLEKFGKKQIQ